MSNTLPLLEAALYTKLTAATAITALIGGTADPRLYNRIAPSGPARPYLVFYAASERLSNDSPRMDVNSVFRVDAVAETRAAADTLQRAVFTVLHLADLTVSGWSAYWMACEGIVSIPQNVEGRQIWRYSGDYRIRADKS